MNDLICPEHSGFCAKIESLEDNVSKLWDKWDTMQKMLIGTLISTMLSLIGVVVILAKIAL
ncbi:hypothetical protein KA005_02305 [bacterium]|nr:hypothetical protein [bacterium]